MCPPRHQRLFVGVVVEVIVDGQVYIISYATVAPILVVECIGRILQVSGDEDFTSATSHDDAHATLRLQIIAESPESGVSIVMARGGREFFITGHMEYAPDTLDKEYRRDKDVRDDVDVPVDYYTDDNPENGPHVTWRAHANLFYSNWINYYVYQETPYNIEDIR